MLPGLLNQAIQSAQRQRQPEIRRPAVTFPRVGCQIEANRNTAARAEDRKRALADNDDESDDDFSSLEELCRAALRPKISTEASKTSSTLQRLEQPALHRAGLQVDRIQSGSGERQDVSRDQPAIFGNDDDPDDARTGGQVEGASGEAHITRIELDTSLHNPLPTSELASAPTQSINAFGPWYDVEEGRYIEEPAPGLQLGALATKMTRLKHFVQVSSAYANSFLPDGPVDEKVYHLSNPDNAEGELEEILRTGTTKYLQGFPWAYAYSKQLMERLMVAQFPDLPMLLLRPTSIGPAIAQPYEMYGPQASCPISTLYARMMQPIGGRSIWYSPTRGDNILDEIPVDLVANVLLQHVHSGTRRVVHASSSYYIPKTLEWILEQPFKYLPAHWVARMAILVFVGDKRVKQSKEAKFYRIGSRAWEFRALSSHRLGSLDRPLRFGLSDHDIDRLNLGQGLFSTRTLAKKGIICKRKGRSISGHWHQQNYDDLGCDLSSGVL